VRNYSDLIVWQRAMELMTESYRLAALLPSSEAFGMVQQVRRAALSVPANFAEGHGRLHRGDFVHHLSIARGSLMELETFLHAAARLGLLPVTDTEPARDLVAQIRRMLSVMLRRVLENRARHGPIVSGRNGAP
jgi:four helix bundle protein